MKKQAFALMAVLLFFGLFGDVYVHCQEVYPVCDNDTRPQPVNTLVLGCPRMDMFRLWPLPIQHTWFEDPWYENPDAPNGYGHI